MVDAIKQYLKNGFGGFSLGGEITLPESFPLAVKAAYRFRRCRIMGKDCILAIAKGTAAHTPRRVQKQIAPVESHFGLPIIFAAGRLNPHDKERFIALNIPLVVPGKIAYLPFAGMRQDESRGGMVINRDSLSPLAQLLLLAFLEHRLPSPVRVADVSELLLCSPTAAQNAFRELEYFGLGERIKRTGTLMLEFGKSGRSLWDNALVLLASPVKKHVGLAEPPPAWCVVAGVDALASFGYLNVQEPTEFATALQGFSKRGLQVVSARDAPFRLQLWAYDPCRLGGDRIDTLSLILSLSENTDDRVRIEIERLLEEFKW